MALRTLESIKNNLNTSYVDIKLIDESNSDENYSNLNTSYVDIKHKLPSVQLGLLQI